MKYLPVKVIKTLYLKFTALMPAFIRSLFIQLLYVSGIKPTFNKSQSLKLNKGVVIFSADFELAWAYRYSKNVKSPIEYGINERNNIPLLLDLFEQYDIPVTWATVGHLFLEKCKIDSSGKIHADLPRPDFFENKNWCFNHGDWYQHDPCSNYKDAPAWYSPDLINKITQSKVQHEIGCHSFSHIDFTYKNCSEALADAEINKCIDLAEKRNIRMKSFVFPGGTHGNYESLKKNGFICYRKSMFFNIDYPEIDKYGLVAIPSSMCLDKGAYKWKVKTYVRHAVKHIIKASRCKLVCHFWFHPSMNSWYLNKVLPEILRQVDIYRKKGQITVITMGGLAEEILKPQSINVNK